MENKLRNKVFLWSGIFGIGVIVAGFVMYEPARKGLGPDDYIIAIKNNRDLEISREIGVITYHCQYIPAEYNAISHLRPGIEKEIMKSAIKDEEGFFYFSFSMACQENGVLDPIALGNNEYAQRIAYFNASAQRNFKLLLDHDTLRCTQYLFESTLNLSSEVRIMLGFKLNTEAQNKDIILIYDDQLFNNGPVRFNYSSKKLQNIPQLVIN